MISILRSVAEVEMACEALADRGLSLHRTPQKNWDHHLLLQLLRDCPLDARILDMGSGDGSTLRVLHESGYTSLRGIDLQAPPRSLRKKLMRMLKPSTFQPCFVIEEGDICSTGMLAESADFITCISVLEHGVDIAAFLKESARVLQPGGRLFLTVDYWEDYEAPQKELPAICGLPWNIFNRYSLERMVETARKFGLLELAPGEIPSGQEKPVHYAGQEYTFAAVGLEKPQSF